MTHFFAPFRTLFLASLILMFTLLPSLLTAQESTEQPQLVQVVESTKSFAETLKRFKEEVSKAGWSVLNANNMAGVLSERGYTIHPVVILDVCSGKYSARILEQDAYRPVSAFMPCRVSIYQTAEGKVYLARMNTGAFAAMMPPEVAEVMVASDQEVDKIIANTVQ
jgi:uncharacterized protein (DUF302 family)